MINVCEFGKCFLLHISVIALKTSCTFFHSTHFIAIIDLACYYKTIDGLQLRHNFFPPKRDYKALDVTVNQRIIPSVGIFKEFDC